MKVLTYYESFGGEHDQLALLWEQNWRNAGWEPEILSTEDIPSVIPINLLFCNLPTRNAVAYSRAVFRRWVAYALRIRAVSGPVLVTDIDVFNNGLVPGDLPNIEKTHSTLLARESPCAAYADEAGLNRIIWDMVFYKPASALQHVSDQEILNALAWPRVEIVCEHLNPGWEQAKLIHFCYAKTVGVGKRSKAETVKDYFKL